MAPPPTVNLPAYFQLVHRGESHAELLQVFRSSLKCGTAVALLKAFHTSGTPSDKHEFYPVALKQTDPS